MLTSTDSGHAGFWVEACIRPMGSAVDALSSNPRTVLPQGLFLHYSLRDDSTDLQYGSRRRTLRPASTPNKRPSADKTDIGGKQKKAGRGCKKAKQGTGPPQPHSRWIRARCLLQISDAITAIKRSHDQRFGVGNPVQRDHLPDQSLFRGWSRGEASTQAALVLHVQRMFVPDPSEGRLGRSLKGKSISIHPTSLRTAPSHPRNSTWTGDLRSFVEDELPRALPWRTSPHDSRCKIVSSTTATQTMARVPACDDVKRKEADEGAEADGGVLSFTG